MHLFGCDRSYSPKIIEPISLDEAFLDVTENKKDIKLAVDIAREIKVRIRKELNQPHQRYIHYGIQ